MNQTTIIKRMEMDTGKAYEVCEYSLPPKEAIVAFKQQQRGNYNTWEYKKYMNDPDIRPLSYGEYCFFVDENTAYYTLSRSRQGVAV